MTVLWQGLLWCLWPLAVGAGVGVVVDAVLGLRDLRREERGLLDPTGAYGGRRDSY